MIKDCYDLFLRLVRACRGLVDRAKWIAPRSTRFFITVIGLTVSLTAALNATQRHQLHVDWKLFQLVGSVVGFILLLIGFVAFSVRKFSLEFHSEASNIEPRLGAREAIFEDGGQRMWTNLDVNRLIEGSASPIEWQPRMSRLDPLVEMFRAQFILRLTNETERARLATFDDKKIGLRTDITTDLLATGRPVELRRTSYFRDRLSNGLLNWRVLIDNRRAFDFVEEAFQVVSQPSGRAEWRLMDLAESRLANQLGASVVLLTSDMRVVFLRQASESAENKNKLAPSGSGSFDARAAVDHRGKTIQALVKAECLRELCEECGLAGSDIAAIQLCGFGRYLYRAGKPEFFCVATTAKASSAIEVPVREWSYQHKEKVSRSLAADRASFDGFCGSIADGLEKNANELSAGNEPVSGPLIWNLRLAAAYLREADHTALRPLLAPLGPPSS